MAQKRFFCWPCPQQHTIPSHKAQTIPLNCCSCARSLHAVLALVVPAQIHFTLEALGTNVTSKRFEACVFPAVGDQIGALAERFTTHLAFVGFFTCEIKHTQTKKKQWDVCSIKNLVSISYLHKGPFCYFWRIRFGIHTINGATRRVRFALISMAEESCHCSDLSNIYGQQMLEHRVPFTEPSVKQENQICKSTGHLFKFLFLIYQ